MEVSIPISASIDFGYPLLDDVTIGSTIVKSLRDTGSSVSFITN